MFALWLQLIWQVPDTLMIWRSASSTCGLQKLDLSGTRRKREKGCLPLLCSEFLIAFSGERHTRFVWGTTFWQLAGSMHGRIRTQKTWTTVQSQNCKVFLLCILALSKFNEAQPSYCLVGTMRAQGVPTCSLVALLCGLGAINAVAVKMASKAPFTKAWVLTGSWSTGSEMQDSGRLFNLNLQTRHEDWAVLFLKTAGLKRVSSQVVDLLADMQQEMSKEEEKDTEMRKKQAAMPWFQGCFYVFTWSCRKTMRDHPKGMLV